MRDDHPASKFRPAGTRLKNSIDTFLISGQESFETALQGLKSVPKAERPDWVVQQIKYYENCISATKWLRAMNSQRRTAK